MELRGVDVLVIFAWPCEDSASAALAVKLAYQTENVVMYSIGDDFPPVTANSVYLLGTCGPPGYLKDLCAKYSPAKVTLIDNKNASDIEITNLIARSELPDNLVSHLYIETSVTIEQNGTYHINPRQSICQATVRNLAENLK